MSGLLLDEMYPSRLAEQLQREGYDVLAVSSPETGLVAWADEDVFVWAHDHARCLVTENIRDYARLAHHLPHSGIIFVLAKRFPRTGSGLHHLGDRLTRILADKLLPAPGEVHWLA